MVDNTDKSEQPFDDTLKRGTLMDWQCALTHGQTTPSKITEMAISASTDPAGEGARVFISFDAEKMRHEASVHIAQTDNRESLHGMPISVKDLFDTQGDVTTAGSLLRRDVQPATHDSEAVRRIRAAGAVIAGRTNMTEFAYSGLGLNPHYGTPRNPYDRDLGRIPGGSSSGAAVSVSDGMALAAIGSDTGGSLRIPAALCGLVGFKPTQARMPMRGVFPLSETLDTIGPIARTVECCATIDAVLAGEPVRRVRPRPINALRLGVLDRYVTDDMDPEVAQAFAAALQRLEKAGVQLTDITAVPLDRIATINAEGGFAAAESYANLATELAQRPEQFDPLVSSRINKGEKISAQSYIAMIKIRNVLIAEMNALTLDIDAIVCPTVPHLAPTISELAAPAEYGRVNLLMLRNPSIANLLNRPAISLPCQAPGNLPVGFSLIGTSGDDRALLDIAATVEPLIGEQAWSS